MNSYSCGGVGHMSRDCVQGSKCYNCSGFVNQIIFFIESSLTDYSVSRATEAENARSPKKGLATHVVPKAIFRAIVLGLKLLKQLMPKNAVPVFFSQWCSLKTLSSLGPVVIYVSYMCLVYVLIFSFFIFLACHD